MRRADGGSSHRYSVVIELRLRNAYVGLHRNALIFMYFRLYTLVLAMLLVTTGCGSVLPRSAPSSGELFTAGSTDSELFVPLTIETALLTRREYASGFPADFIAQQEVDPSVLGIGDRLQVLVWENTQVGLFSTDGGHTDMGVSEIDEDGRFYVPYAGFLDAAGHNITSLRKRIRVALEQKTLAPQVDVRMVESVSRRVTVQGNVIKPGVYFIDKGVTRLTQMLATSGGTTLSPSIVEVTIQRGGRSESALLQDIYDDSTQNVALVPGDVIVLNDIAPVFSVFGATELQGQIKFTRRDLSLLEAMGLARGLQDEKADPSGIFLFRHEATDLADRLLGPSPADDSKPATRPVVYRLDMTKPEGVFVAKTFQMRDGDTLIMTNAPYTSLRKAMSIFGRIPVTR